MLHPNELVSTVEHTAHVDWDMEVQAGSPEAKRDILADTEDQGWWQKLNDIELKLVQDIFGADEPTEQLIVGQHGRGIRFYNYSEPMSNSRVKDCERFVDIVTQYFGDRAYELATDVVIADFKDLDILGAVDSLIPHTIFINTKYADTAGNMAGEFLPTLLHEFGHTAHGTSKESRGSLRRSLVQLVGIWTIWKRIIQIGTKGMMYWTNTPRL